MADLTVNDIIQQYDKTVIMYKGKPCKVKQIGKVIKLLDLLSQKEKLVEFKLEDFHTACLRLGYVNIDETAIYVSRRPVRMMKVGIDSNNCFFQETDSDCCPNPIGGIYNKVKAMECPEFGNMMMGNYPKIDKAFDRAQSFTGCVAFDKQFAVDARGFIFFKGKLAGTLKKIKDVSLEDINFQPKKAFLQSLLGNNYEKAVRIPR